MNNQNVYEPHYCDICFKHFWDKFCYEKHLEERHHVCLYCKDMGISNDGELVKFYWPLTLRIHICLEHMPPSLHAHFQCINPACPIGTYWEKSHLLSKEE